MCKHRFVDAIRAHLKQQTVRANGPRQYLPHEAISLRFWSDVAYRSSQIEIIKAQVFDVTPIQISRLGYRCPELRLMQSTDEFAVADGFTNWTELWAFFEVEHKLKRQDVFDGRLIRWCPLPAQAFPTQHPHVSDSAIAAAG